MPAPPGLRHGHHRRPPIAATLGRTRRQAPFEGSFRQRRGRVLARLRAGPELRSALDPEALASLVADGLATTDGNFARLP